MCLDSKKEDVEHRNLFRNFVSSEREMFPASGGLTMHSIVAMLQSKLGMSFSPPLSRTRTKMRDGKAKIRRWISNEQTLTQTRTATENEKRTKPRRNEGFDEAMRDVIRRQKFRLHKSVLDDFGFIQHRRCLLGKKCGEAAEYYRNACLPRSLSCVSAIRIWRNIYAGHCKRGF